MAGIGRSPGHRRAHSSASSW